MKAVVYTEYGSPDVLQIKEVPQPVPKDNEILIKIYAVSVNFGDLMARNFSSVTPRNFNMPGLFWFIARLSFGWNKPKNNILGSEFAGEVVAVGKDVTQWSVRDVVFGYRSQAMRAAAEYLCMAENGVVAHKPDNLTYEEAAVIPYGAITALNLLSRVNIQSGQKVLIVGASGNIGSAAVQLAKQAGAEVTGVCSTPRVDLVRSLGADKVIDYTREDFTQNGETYDLIFDILGRSSFARCKVSLRENGRYLLASFKLKQLLQMVGTAIMGDKKVICALAPERREDLEQIKTMIEAGQFKTALDRTFPLEQAAEAHRYSEQGQKRGHVAITIATPDSVD